MKQFKISSINFANTNVNEKIEEKNSENVNFSKLYDSSKHANNLNIEIISSSFEPKGLVIKLNPFGYEKSERKANDGITYFGYEENKEKVKVRKYINNNIIWNKI